MNPFDATGSFLSGVGSSKLRGQAVRGAGATVFASGLSLALQVVTTVMLARVLSPADFGVVTMVTTFSFLLVNVGANGLTEAIIQCEEIDRYTASNLFWLNAGAGMVVALVFAACGSLLAGFYRNPLVANVAVAVSVQILIAGASVIHLALLKRAMRFGATSFNEVFARAAYSAVAFLLALKGWRYWALVAGLIAHGLSTTIGAWWLCRWIPSPPQRTGKTVAAVRFAAKVYGRFCLGYSMQNIDNLLVGWRFNAVALGFYKKAYDLFTLSGSQLTSPLNNVALAALSRLNHDHVRFRRYLANSLGMIAFAGMAMSADLTLVGKDVVRLVLGPQWSESGRIFELFGPGIGVMLLCSTVGWIHLSLGKPGRWLFWSIVELSFTVSLFLAALPWGPSGIATAWSVSYWIFLIPGLWYAGRPIRFGVSAFVAAVWRYAAAALTAGIVTAAIIRGTPFWYTASSSSAALWAIMMISTLFFALYLGTTIVLHWGLAPLRELASIVRELAPSSRKDTGVTAEPVGVYK